MNQQQDMAAARGAILILGMVVVVGVLLILDLINRGLVWRMLQALKSENTGSLPGEERTVGDSQRTDVTFIS